MNFISLPIDGGFKIISSVFHDNRGTFTKVYHREEFQNRGIEANFSEQFFSRSTSKVLRGLHFQLPPHDHVKMVYCAYGAVFDVALDLRVNSPTFGQHAVNELDAESGHILYLPKGIAHGFYTLSDMSILVYNTSTSHSPQHDAGVLWNSADIPWPSLDPIISERDSQFTTLSDFNSPFLL